MSIKNRISGWIERGPFLFFFFFALFLRFWTLTCEVIDHDESTYMVMADGMLSGKLIYKDLIDIKPLGIFLLFGGMLSISKSVIAIRIGACFFVAATAFVICKIRGEFSGNRQANVFAGLGYVIMVSMVPAFKIDPVGLAFNTEIAFVFFASWSLWLLLKADFHDWLLIALAGLVGGLGFVVKYHVLFDAMGFFVIGISLKKFMVNKRFSFKQFLACGVVYLACFLIPFVGVMIYYWLIGEIDVWRTVTFEMSSRHTSNLNIKKWLQFISSTHQLAVVMVLVYLGLFFKSLNNLVSKLKTIGLIWFGFVCIGLLVGSKQWDHNKVQLMAPLSILLPLFWFESTWMMTKMSNRIRVRLAWGYVVFITFVTWGFHIRDYYSQSMKYTAIAEFLMSESEEFLIFNTVSKGQVVYLLSGSECPSRTAHTFHLYDERNQFVIGIDLQAEYDHVFSQQPDFVIGDDKNNWQYVSDFKQNYELSTVIEDVPIYTRRD